MGSSEIWKRIVRKNIKVDQDKCIGGKTFYMVCPFMVYEMEKTAGNRKIAVPRHTKDCFLCQSCQAECPTDAITIEW